MHLTDTPSPSDELVRWASLATIGLHTPGDRPWYLATPPPQDALRWEYLCACSRQHVIVRRYLCADGEACVYIGQCLRCEAVVWAFRDLKASSF
ncbi:MAG: hypothetical protein K2R98_04830 [Gemmataceae bacterium]|nr:hypothetical protein [Gemmataceae bacterium]